MAPSRGALLLVSNNYLPADAPQTSRPRLMAEHLARLGYEVTVIGSTAWISEEAAEESPIRVIRARDLMASGLNWRRRSFATHTAREGWEYWGKPSLAARAIVPDLAAVTWTPFARAAATRLAREARIHCVLTSSPANSVHEVGLALRRRGVPWVAELRDGWRFERPLGDWRTGAQRRLDAHLEHRALTAADQVTTVSEPVSADLRKRLGVEAATITNGFDPDELPSGEADPGSLDPERHSIVYTGRLGVADSSPEPVLEAVRLIAKRDPDALGRLEVVFAGPLTAEERQQLEDPALRGTIRYLGVLEREASLRLQRQADTLLLLIPPGRPATLTSKLFDYLGAGRSILVIGEGTAPELVERLGVGTSVSGRDPGAIAEALLSAARDAAPPQRDEEAIRELEYPRLAERMAEVIEAARESGRLRDRG